MGESRGPALWHTIVDAAAGRAHASARIVAELATAGGQPRLAWVLPPGWPQVVRVLAPFASVLRARRVVFVGTGGWAFGARALADAAGPSTPLRVVDVLDHDALTTAAGIPPAGRTAAFRPPAFARAEDDAGASGGTAVVAVSESGRTLETVTLATALRDGWGLPARWLTAGQLSLHPTARTVALFAAPCSVPFLLAAAVAAGGLDALAGAYRAFVETVPAIGSWAGAAALRIPPGRSHVCVVLPRDSGDGLELFVRQALRQGLGGKNGAARLWFDVGSMDGAASVADVGAQTVNGGQGARADVAITLPDAAAGTHPLAGVMARCYAACALAACVGVRRRIAFATHPAVDVYKVRLGHPARSCAPVDPDRIVRRAATWLRRRSLAAGHMVCYEPRLAGRLLAAADRLAVRSDRPWEAHAGSTWNHHSFQAVYPEPGIGVVVVMPASGSDPLSRVQTRIAEATCASFGDRALLLRPVARGQEPRS